MVFGEVMVIIGFLNIFWYLLGQMSGFRTQVVVVVVVSSGVGICLYSSVDEIAVGLGWDTVF